MAKLSRHTPSSRSTRTNQFVRYVGSGARDRGNTVFDVSGRFGNSSPSSPSQPSLSSLSSSGAGVDIENLLFEAERARQQGNAANEARYRQLIEGHANLRDSVLGRLKELRNSGLSEQANRLEGIANRYKALETGAKTRFANQGKASRQALNAGEKKVKQAFGGREERLGKRQAETEKRYADRTKEIGSLFKGLGQQASDDINRRFDQEKARATSSLVSRGLFNTTVLDSVNRGIEEDRSAEQRRLAEQLRDAEISLQRGLTAEELDARNQGTALAERTSGATAASDERGVDRRMGLLGNLRREGTAIEAQFGLPQLAFASDAARRQTGLEESLRRDELANMAGLEQNRLGVIERRTDEVPSLADIANLALQAGRSDPSPVFGTGSQAGLRPGFWPAFLPGQSPAGLAPFLAGVDANNAAVLANYLNVPPPQQQRQPGLGDVARGTQAPGFVTYNPTTPSVAQQANAINANAYPWLAPSIAGMHAIAGF